MRAVRVRLDVVDLAGLIELVAIYMLEMKSNE